jgi:hypothetical protein
MRCRGSLPAVVHTPCETLQCTCRCRCPLRCAAGTTSTTQRCTRQPRTAPTRATARSSTACRCVRHPGAQQIAYHTAHAQATPVPHSRLPSPDIPLAVCARVCPLPQRAHQNSLENEPIFLALLTISGLQVSSQSTHSCTCMQFFARQIPTAYAQAHTATALRSPSGASCTPDRAVAMCGVWCAVSCDRCLPGRGCADWPHRLL